MKFRNNVNVSDKGSKLLPKMVPVMKNISYEDRLEKFGLSFLGKRKLRGDLIKEFKIRRGLDRVNREKMFPLGKGRGYRLKVI
eukprot:g29217.t1